MTLLLAIDTSTDSCSVALSSTTGIHQESVLIPRGHTQQLLPLVDQLLTSHGVSANQLDAIAFGSGPGSFTGLRICISVAQGLAYAVDCPVIPILTLKAMAHAAVRERLAEETDVIVPALDARMEEIYWAAFQLNLETRHLSELAKAQVTGPGDMDFPLFSSRSLCALGSGWYYDDLQKLQPRICSVEYYPQAYDIAELGRIEFDAGNVISPFMATPTYLRNEVKWQKRQRIRNEKADII